MLHSRGFFDLDTKQDRFAELERVTQEPEFWNDAEKARTLQRERSSLEVVLKSNQKVAGMVADAKAAFELAYEAKDEEFLSECLTLAELARREIEAQEFRRKMSGDYDRASAFIEVNAGAGGTEAQDWASLLLRMYLRWAERKGFTCEELDYQPGEQAGIKSATILVTGEYSYGHLRSEAGVHRLVRISPFDSNARRHTSFASVSVSPDIEEDIDIQIRDEDLKMDTYRSGGAGGQHVNKTDSAVRLTHIPTGIIVACQSQRSQHKNKAHALKVLKSRLFELEKREQEEKLAGIQGERKKIEWGSQIRSYVMQPYQMVKDLRTDFETSSIQEVLDGKIDGFIEAFLMGATIDKK